MSTDAIGQPRHRRDAVALDDLVDRQIGRHRDDQLRPAAARRAGAVSIRSNTPIRASPSPNRREGESSGLPGQAQKPADSGESRPLRRERNESPHCILSSGRRGGTQPVVVWREGLRAPASAARRARSCAGAAASARAGRARRDDRACHSPCCAPSHSRDAPRHSRSIIRSRSCLATIEAAAIDRHSASPATIASEACGQFGQRLPSTRIIAGAVPGLDQRIDGAVHRQHRRPQDVERCRSPRRVAMPTPTAATCADLAAQILARARRRASSKSSMPLGTLRRLSTTAAATTGPASGPRPASSTPATGSGCGRSSLKEGPGMRRRLARRRGGSQPPFALRLSGAMRPALWPCR